MPWRSEPKKDVAKLRKAPGSRLAGFDPGMSEIGKPSESHVSEPLRRRERWELKHLSTNRKVKKTRLPK